MAIAPYSMSDFVRAVDRLRKIEKDIRTAGYEYGLPSQVDLDRDHARRDLAEIFGELVRSAMEPQP